MPRRESQAVKRLRNMPGPWIQASPLQNEWPVQFYRKNVVEFLTNNEDDHWPGLNYHVHSRTHYLFISIRDVYLFLRCKFGLPEVLGLDAYHQMGSFTRQMHHQSFVKVRRTAVGQSYAYTAPKKRLDRWFKQNINRFN